MTAAVASKPAPVHFVNDWLKLYLRKWKFGLYNFMNQYARAVVIRQCCRLGETFGVMGIYTLTRDNSQSYENRAFC